MDFVENNRFVDFRLLGWSCQSGLQPEHSHNHVDPVLVVERGAWTPQDSQFIGSSLRRWPSHRSSYPQRFTEFDPRIKNKSFSLI